MTIWLLWTANSATSTSTFLFGSLLMIAGGLRLVARRPALVHLLVASSAFIAYAALFLNLGLTSAVGRNSSLTGRTEIWATVLSLVTNPWFGTGVESFWLGARLEKIWAIYWFHPIEAHNGYLEVYLNLGWIGVTLLAGIVAQGYRSVLAGFRQDPELVTLRLAYLVAALIYSLTEAAFKMMSLVWIALLLAAIMIPKRSVRHDSVANGKDAGVPMPSSSDEETSIGAEIHGRPGTWAFATPDIRSGGIV